MLKAVEESTGSVQPSGLGQVAPIGAGIASLSASSSVSAVPLSAQESIAAEMKKAVQRAADSIDELAERQIADAVVALLSGYIQSIILGLHKEGVSSFNSPGKSGNTSGTSSSDAAVDCSLAVQTLAKQVPTMLRSHLISSLPKCSIVDNAVEEVHSIILIINTYFSSS